MQRRIEGAPNFRRVPMVLRPVHSGSLSPDGESDFVVEGNGKMVCGRSVFSINFLRNMYYIKPFLIVECQRSKGSYCLSLFLEGHLRDL